jgi:hypothetical protein
MTALSKNIKSDLQAQYLLLNKINYDIQTILRCGFAPSFVNYKKRVHSTRSRT